MLLNRHALTALREARLLTKSELAKRADITVSYVSELEAGNRLNPSLDVVRKLSEALDTSAQAFYVPRGVLADFARSSPGDLFEILHGEDAA